MLLTETSKLNNLIFNNINITSQENNIIKFFSQFYEKNENTEIFIYLTSNKSPISIRLIDHFITKFSKTNKTNYKLKENNVEQIFNVYTSYKQQLKTYQKKYFDPFSRGERIPFFMNGICIITTISQLNFFKWFISKKIYEYVLSNQNLIDNDMNQKTRINTKVKKTIIKPKLITHNIQNTQSYNTYNMYTKPTTNNIIVSFN